MPYVTVFTPVYNRAYTIGGLYKSLCRQTNKDFEWIIVNDGSTDNIDELINEWILKDNGFIINYISVANQGKHCAINTGVKMAEGVLFFIIDSDDYLTDNAIYRLIQSEKYLPAEKFAGVSFNRGYAIDKLVGKTFKGDYVDSTALQRRKYKIFGDKAEVFYTEVLAKYPFPKFEGENFIQETVIWYKIANDGYLIRWFNEIIYICDYLPDGLTANKNLGVNNFEGYTYSVKQTLSYELPIIDKLIQTGVYAYTAKLKDLSMREASKRINVILPLLIFAYFTYSFKRFMLSVFQKLKGKSI